METSENIINLDGFGAIVNQITQYCNGETIDFDDEPFEAERTSFSLGWVLRGRSARFYGRDANGRGNYVTTVGYPHVARSRDGRIRGWRTRREAEAAGRALWDWWQKTHT